MTRLTFYRKAIKYHFSDLGDSIHHQLFEIHLVMASHWEICRDFDCPVTSMGKSLLLLDQYKLDRVAVSCR